MTGFARYTSKSARNHHPPVGEGRCHRRPQRHCQPARPPRRGTTPEHAGERRERNAAERRPFRISRAQMAARAPAECLPECNEQPTSGTDTPTGWINLSDGTGGADAEPYKAASEVAPSSQSVATSTTPPPPGTLYVDMHLVTFIDSSGIGALVASPGRGRGNPAHAGRPVDSSETCAAHGRAAHHLRSTAGIAAASPAADRTCRHAASWQWTGPSPTGLHPSTARGSR